MKEPVKDFIHTTDLVIQNGDFLVEGSDSMHIEHILKADKGQFRQWPLVGVGAYKKQNASIDRQRFAQEIRLQLNADNFLVKRVVVTPGDEMIVDIDAKRRK